MRLGINIPNEPITIRIMPFSQYPVSLEYFIHLESLGLQLVDYWYRLLVVFPPMNLPLQHCRAADSGASADFEAADCAASPRSRAQLEQGSQAGLEPLDA